MVAVSQPARVTLLRSRPRTRATCPLVPRTPFGSRRQATGALVAAACGAADNVPAGVASPCHHTVMGPNSFESRRMNPLNENENE